MHITTQPRHARSFSLADALHLGDDTAMEGPPPIDREALIRDPALRRAMEKVIQGRVPDADVEDVLWRTYRKVAATEHLPAEPKAQRKYVLGMTRNEALEYRRELKRKPETDGELDVDRFASNAAGTEGAATVESRQFLHKVAASLPGDKMSTFHSWMRHTLGEDLAAIAREQGIHADTLRKRVDKLQERLRAAAISLAGIGVLILVLAGAWRIVRPKPQIGREPYAPIPTTATSTGPVSDNTEDARKLRDQAFAECTANEWKKCLDDLDMATRLDESLYNDPLVRAAYKDCFDAMNPPKDHPFVPPKVRPYAPHAGTR